MMLFACVVLCDFMKRSRSSVLTTGQQSQQDKANSVLYRSIYLNSAKLLIGSLFSVGGYTKPEKILGFEIVPLTFSTLVSGDSVDFFSCVSLPPPSVVLVPHYLYSYEKL